MKRIYIIVEGQTEQAFVDNILTPYLNNFDIWNITACLIRTSSTGRGGFVNYAHLRNDAKRLLCSSKNDFIVTTFVDFFRIPELPNKERYETVHLHTEKVAKMEQCMSEDINDHRFLPYIQLHEFEALLYSSNVGFESMLDESQSKATEMIINQYENPEDINSSPEGAPSKRLLAIKNDYEKVLDGNIIAMEIGIEKIIEKCPRFKNWIETLILQCQAE